MGFTIAVHSSTVRAAAVWGAAFLLVACASSPEAERAASPAACALLAEADTMLEERGLESRVAPRTVSSNEITINKITINELGADHPSFHQLVRSSLSSTKTVTNGATPADGHVLQELAATESGRELLQYAVRCAFRPGQTLEISRDHGLLFEGRLGLAPAWEMRALTVGEERWVSACLLAHVNAFGRSVPLSVRASGSIEADGTEREAFPVHEGAFFGSAANGALYSCHADAPERARAESADRSLRVCTDRDAGCAVESVGPCATVCERYEEGIGFSDCHAGGVRYAEVVNVHLRSNAVLGACGLR